MKKKIHYFAFYEKNIRMLEYVLVLKYRLYDDEKITSTLYVYYHRT